ncbi:hypothetical protein LINGRAHAP2_LOCUS19086, partial [Linum grandiflorum]
MSFMKGDLLSRTRRLVKGMAKPEPVWLKAMEQAPPATFPLSNAKIQKITLPEDPYIKKFFQKHPALQPEPPVSFSSSCYSLCDESFLLVKMTIFGNAFIKDAYISSVFHFMP